MDETALKILVGVTALVGVVNGAIAVYIAFRQYGLSSEKLRLDLYQHRFAVYRGLMKLFGAIASDGTVSRAALADYYRDTAEKNFFFDECERKYFTEVREKAVQLHQLFRLIDPDARPPVPEARRDAAIEQETSLLSWFDTQIEEAPKRFEKALGFRSR